MHNGTSLPACQPDSRVLGRDKRPPGPYRMTLTPGACEQAVAQAYERALIVLQSARTAPGESVLKRSKRALTLRTGPYVVKVASPANLRMALSDALFTPDPVRAWRNGLRLARQGVCVPPLVGLVEPQAVHMPAAILYGFVHRAVTVEAFVQDRAAQGDIPAAACLLTKIAQGVRSLERACAYHRDLSGKNLLTLDGRQCMFVDLGCVHFDKPYGSRRRFKNHVQLYDSFVDVLPDAVLRDFLGMMLPAHVDVDAWMGAVKDGQQQRRRRFERRRARLTAAPYAEIYPAKPFPSK